MSKLVIKTALPPRRCEVCHKDDRFDAGRNYCSRCSGIAEVEFTALPRFKTFQRPQRTERHPLELIAALWFGFAGFVPFLFIFFLTMAGRSVPSHILQGLMIYGLLPALIAGFIGWVSGSGILYRANITTSRQAMKRGAGVAFKSLIFYTALSAISISLSGSHYTNLFSMLIAMLIGSIIVAGLPVSIIGAVAGWTLFKFFQPKTAK